MKKILQYSVLAGFLFFIISFANNVLLSQALNQGFNTATFPPTGWTQTAGLWEWNSSSAYGYGQGSAMANFYDIETGTFPLTSLTFSATAAGDSLIFAEAYCTYIDEVDQLQIQYSTNGGSSFTTLITLDGGISGPLVTAPPNLDPWLSPAANEWKYQRLALPVGTTKIQFNGISAYGNNLFIDSIYVKNVLVGIEPTGNTPDKFSLEQNYPNPFNPVTNIRFSIPKAGNVKLVIIDMLGREVATILNEVKSPGSYSIDYNASELSSGVYLYRLETGSYVETRKMMLVK